MYKAHSQTRRSVMVALLGAIAFLLMFLEFPVIPIVSYLKLDFSDVPVLVGTLLEGPVTGIMIAIIKCLLHGLVHGFAPVELLGLGADFCSSLALILPFAWSFHHFKQVKRALWTGSVAATVLLTLVMTTFNYYVLTPAYMAMFAWHPSLPIKQLMLVGVLPFNLLKGILISLVFAIVVIHLRHSKRLQI